MADEEARKEYLQLKCLLQETEVERDAIKAVIGKQKKEISELKDQVRSHDESHEGLEKALARETEKSGSLSTQLNQILSEREQADSDAQDALNLLRRLEKKKGGECATPIDLDSSMGNFSFEDRQESEIVEGTLSNAARLRLELEHQVAQREAAENKLREEASSFELEANDMQDRLAEEIEKRAALKEQIAAAHSAQKDATTEAENIQTELTSVTSELELLKATHLASTTEAANLQTEHATIKEQLQASQTELQTLLASQAEDNSRVQAEQKEASDRLEAANSEVQTLKSELQEMKSAQETQLAAMTALETEKTAGGEQLAALQTELDSVKAAAAQSTEAVQAELDAVKAAAAESAQAVQAASTDADQQATTVQKLQTEVAEAADALKLKELAVADLEEASAALKEELAKAEQGNVDVTAERAKQAEEVQKYQDAVASLEDQLSSVSAQVQALQEAAVASKTAAEEELRACKEEAKQQQESAQQVAASAAAAAAAATQAAADAEKSTQSGADRVQEQETEIATLKEKVVGLEQSRDAAVESARNEAAEKFTLERASLAATYRAALEKLKAKYQAEPGNSPAASPTASSADLNAYVDPNALQPLPVNLAEHQWLNVRSNFHHLRLRPQGVEQQWRVHDVRMYDAEGNNLCTDPNRMQVSGMSVGEASDACKQSGAYWEAPTGSKDASWLRYDLPSEGVVWRVETRSSADPGLAPLCLVLEGSRDGSEWVSVSWAFGSQVKPQRVYLNGEFLQPNFETEVLHQISL